MKSGRPHRVPLSGRAVELFAGLPRDGSDNVFLGRSAGVRSNPHGLRRLLKRMEHGVTAHGFRASFRTWAGERTNFPRELIEVSLAHAVGDATEEAYNRGDMLARRRQLMEAWSEYCSPAARRRRRGAPTNFRIGRERADETAWLRHAGLTTEPQ
jgi:integrase